MPSPEVSRQFTDAERAIDSRISSHLQAPGPSLTMGESLGQSYKWLKDDLELRDKMNDNLGAEQRMSYAQGEKHYMADKRAAEKNNQDEAMLAMKDLNGRIAAGESPDAAYRSVVGSNAAIAANPTFNSLYKNFDSNFTSEEEEKQKDLKFAMESLRLGNEKMTLDAMEELKAEDPERFEASVRSLADAKITEALTAKQSADLKSAKTLVELDAANAKRDRVLARGDIPEGDMDQLAELESMVGSLPGKEDGSTMSYADPLAVIGRFRSNPATMSVIMDDDFLVKLDFPQRKEFMDAVDVASSADSDVEARKEAQRVVRKYAARRMSETRDQREVQARRKAMQTVRDDVSKVVTPAYNKLMTQLDDGDQGKIVSQYEAMVSAAEAKYGTDDEEISKLIGWHRDMANARKDKDKTIFKSHTISFMRKAAGRFRADLADILVKRNDPNHRTLTRDTRGGGDTSVPGSSGAKNSAAKELDAVKERRAAKKAEDDAAAAAAAKTGTKQ